jgi:hypothetical protein
MGAEHRVHVVAADRDPRGIERRSGVEQQPNGRRVVAPASVPARARSSVTISSYPSAAAASMAETLWSNTHR